MDNKNSIELIERLLNENCISKQDNNRLAVYPDWLTHKDIISMVKSNLFTMVYFQGCYNHTDYYLNKFTYNRMRGA